MKLNQRLIKFAMLQKRGKKLPRFPRSIAPKGIEREYERAIVPYLQAYKRVVDTHVMHRLAGLASSVYLHRDSADDVLGAFDGIPIALQREFTEDDLRELAFKFGYSVSEFNEKILKKQFKEVLGLDLLMDEPYLNDTLQMFAASNATLITNVTEAATNKIQAMAFEGFRTGRRWEDISSDIEDYIDPETGPPRARARLIARDQVSKLNGNLTQLRQEKLGVERYTWRTMLDERVRDDHSTKEGEIFDWDDPPADTGHPGDDIQCRCYAEPILDDLVDDDENDESEDQEE
jgi:SPP1 gp7 family putative phage head morphogenesis protein